MLGGIDKLMKASALCISLIKHVEGWEPKQYPDRAGKSTIGYGHLIVEGEEFGCLTREEGHDLLMLDISKAEWAVNSSVEVPLKQPQFDALVCFVYNVGATQWAKSDTLKILNQGHLHEIPERLMMWNKITVKGKKVESKGLTNRRIKEVAMWEGKLTEKDLR